MDHGGEAPGRAVPDRLATARTVLVWALVVQLVVLVATGLYLQVAYRPTSAQAWEDIYGLARHTEQALWVRRAHRVTTAVAVPTSIALLVVLAVQRQVRARVVVAACVTVDLVVAALTGSLLPWDQLGLREVTVGSDLHGYGPIFGDRVRFAIIRGAEVSPGTVRAWLVVHVVVGALALAGAVLLLVRRRVRADGGAAGPA